MSNQKVTVTVLDVDLKRKRISLSMKSGQSKAEAPRRSEDTGKAPVAGIKRDRSEKKPVRFTNNPFYEAFSKKK